MELQKLTKDYLAEEAKETFLEAPVRIAQFGEGNFLRAFTDWVIENMNHHTDFKGKIAVIQPIERGMVDRLNIQDGLYTLFLKGLKNGEPVREKQLIQCLEKGINPYSDFEAFLELSRNPDIRFIISNTTEAGISTEADDLVDMKPPASFPGKLVLFLYERFRHFGGDLSKGLILLPCELIDDNGKHLKEAVLHYAQKWDLESGFIQWVHTANQFCGTLVDRIVPGFPRDTIQDIWQELGYEDQLVVEGEHFHLWVIEAPKSVKEEFPADQADLNVLFVDDLKPYKIRKVRILNGAHTSMVPVGYLYGLDMVKETVEHEVMGQFVKKAIFDEIVPTLSLPKEELELFSEQVLERFRNPYIKHYLLSISLNSMSKFRTRVLPSLLTYQNERGELPSLLTFSLAALIYFYKGQRGEERIDLKDNADILELYKKLWEQYDETREGMHKLVEEVLGYTVNWETDLNQVPGLTDKITEYLWEIHQKGMKSAVTDLLG